MSAYSHNHTSSCVRRFCRSVPDRSVFLFFFFTFFVFSIRSYNIPQSPSSFFFFFISVQLQQALACCSFTSAKLPSDRQKNPVRPLFSHNSLPLCLFFFLRTSGLRTVSSAGSRLERRTRDRQGESGVTQCRPQKRLTIVQSRIYR